MNDDKKKKGNNYTKDEREALLAIVNGYIGIIENKYTNGDIIKKKVETWKRIAQKFNAVATSGPRTWVQLRHAYANMKQRTKKAVANENKQQYNAKDVNYVKLKATEDKKNLMKTGGGAYKSVLTEVDNQLLAMVAPQITPLPNPYDDAAAYFDDANFVAVYGDDEGITIEGNRNLVVEDLITRPADEVVNEITIGELEETELEAGEVETRTNKPTKPRQRNKVKGKTTAKTVKEKYFTMKLQNAKLERKLLLQKHKKESLEIHLLKLKIKSFRK